MANSKTIGTAYADPEFESLSVTGAATITGAATVAGATSLNGNVAIGNAAADLVGFHGATAVDQAAVKATVTVSNTITVLVDAVNAILDLLKEKGLMATS
jgi:hypothetical protein